MRLPAGDGGRSPRRASASILAISDSPPCRLGVDCYGRIRHEPRGIQPGAQRPCRNSGGGGSPRRWPSRRAAGRGLDMLPSVELSSTKTTSKSSLRDWLPEAISEYSASSECSSLSRGTTTEITSREGMVSQSSPSAWDETLSLPDRSYASSYARGVSAARAGGGSRGAARRPTPRMFPCPRPGKVPTGLAVLQLPPPRRSVASHTLTRHRVLTRLAPLRRRVARVGEHRSVRLHPGNV